MRVSSELTNRRSTLANIHRDPVKMSDSESSALLSLLGKLNALVGAYLDAPTSVDEHELDQIIDGFALLETRETVARHLAASRATSVVRELQRLRERAHALRQTHSFCRCASRARRRRAWL